MGKSEPSRALSKVPEVTVFFWIIKVLCTTVGETFSDFFNEKLGYGLRTTSIAAGILLAVGLAVQFKVKRYVPAIYWLTVVLISIFGTLCTDILTDSLKFPLEYSTIICSVLLAATFAIWYANEKTLSIHSIYTVKREVFYWLAILFTFALGTATGDLYGEKLGLGYLTTGLIVVGIIAATGIAWRLGLDAVLAFWIAYILTRPLGASLGDYLSQPHVAGGLGLGPTVTSAIFLVAILAVVAYLSFTHRDNIEDPLAPGPPEKKVGWQVVAAVGLLVIAGGVGYKLRKDQLEDAARASVRPGRPLGDLTAFQEIVQAALEREQADDMSSASSRADDLEAKWDDAQAVMQAMNPDKWTLMDDAIDRVLLSIRAVSPERADIEAALKALLGVIDSLDNPTSEVAAVAPDASVAEHHATLDAAVPSAPPGRPLGDLSAYRKLAQDMLEEVHTLDLSGAAAGANTIEKTWDDAEATMKPMNKAKWTEMDGAIDKVLQSIRRAKDPTASGTALEALLAVIASLDPPP